MRPSLSVTRIDEMFLLSSRKSATSHPLRSFTLSHRRRRRAGNHILVHAQIQLADGLSIERSGSIERIHKIAKDRAVCENSVRLIVLRIKSKAKSADVNNGQATDSIL